MQKKQLQDKPVQLFVGNSVKKENTIIKRSPSTMLGDLFRRVPSMDQTKYDN